MMHPLRFPNNGIRVNVFMRKIGFKLRVMRLNLVELFYTLKVAIGSESRRCMQERGGHMHAVYMQRWLATTKPPIWATGHGLATCKWRPAAATRRGSSPQGAATRGHSRLWPAHKGLPPVASPSASRGGGAGRRGGRPLARRLPTAKGCRRLRRGNDGDTVRVKED
ncbi:hypothetical protein BHE74_00038448 [Ensete ventricosum]|nr:hypothetical protein BHE74_00038448 [Ensete ventricosum]